MSRRKGAFDLEAVKDTGKPRAPFGGPADTAVGDFDRAFAAAPVQLDATYTTPDQAHAMMEPHASIAAWNGDKLTLWTSNQMIAWGVGDLAKTLDIPKENVRLVSSFVGGGFGGKLFLRSDALLAALGARATGRPVNLHGHDECPSPRRKRRRRRPGAAADEPHRDRHRSAGRRTARRAVQGRQSA